MHRTILFAGLCAWLGACGSSSTTPPGPPTIDDGVRLTYELGDGSLDAAAQVMRRRLQLAHIKGWASAQGNLIVVDLAGDDAEALAATRELIARTGDFQIRIVDDDAAVMHRLVEAAARDASAQAAGIAVDADLWQTPDGAKHGDPYLRAADREDAVDVPTARRLGCYHGGQEETDGRVRCMITGRFALDDYLRAAAATDASLQVPDDHQVAFERIAPADERRPSWRSYYLVRAPVLTGQAIAGARPFIDRDTDRPAVRITLRADAATAFGELTRKNVGKKLALLIDDRVVSAPIVSAPITGGQLSLTMAADALDGDDRQLAIVLSSGPLPGPVILDTLARLQHGKVIADPNE